MACSRRRCLRAAAGTAGGRRARARSTAPIDLTGYWVSVVTEDWRWRMLTPPKGDAQSVPINAEGKRVTDAWDLAKDEAAGNPVQGVWRRRDHASAGTAAHHVAGRCDVEDRNRRRHPDAAAGLRSGEAAAGARRRGRGSRAPSGRGPSVDGAPVRRRRRSVPTVPGGGGSGLRGGPPPTGAISEGGSLKVVTTNFREGYLRKNGVPYSEDAIDHRILRPAAGLTERRRLAARDDRRRGSEVPDAAVLHEHALQARARRVEVEPDAVPHRPAAEMRGIVNRES